MCSIKIICRWKTRKKRNKSCDLILTTKKVKTFLRHCNIVFLQCIYISNKNHNVIISGSDCILHGYIKKLGGPFASAWQTRYAKLYPNRLELHPESATKPELVFLDQVNISLYFTVFYVT